MGGTMRGTVLVVDDDPEVRATLSEYLRGEGFDVLEAANGLEALLHVKRAHPQAVVLDLMMPRLGGLEALERIRAFDGAIGVVVITGVEDVELHRRALALGALAVFAKPVRVADIVAALGGASRQPAATSPAPAAPPVPAAKILVVDDEPEVCAMLEEVLATMGYAARSAPDGPSGVRAVREWAPDVVLLDIEMPGLSGIGALPQIAAVAPSTRVIMVSGTTNLEVARRALAFGAFDYVTKPVDLAYLARSIETALTMRRLEGGNPL